jgi:hypothetical protein
MWCCVCVSHVCCLSNLCMPQAGAAAMSEDMRKAGQAYEAVITALRADSATAAQACDAMQAKVVAAEERAAALDVQLATLAKEMRFVTAVGSECAVCYLCFSWRGRFDPSVLTGISWWCATQCSKPSSCTSLACDPSCPSVSGEACASSTTTRHASKSPACCARDAE